MKNLLIKLGLWEEKEHVFADLTWEETQFHNEALKHYCGKCNRWFEKYVGKLSHQRLVHEGVMRKHA